MDIYIPNATPNSNHLGTKDHSARPATNAPVARAQHMAFIPFQSPKGSLEEAMFDGNSFANLYGAEALQEDSPYFNHASVFLKGLMQSANVVIGKRILPKEAEKYAAVRLWLDVLETEGDVYERDPTGAFKLDASGAKIPTGATTTVYETRVVTTPIAYTVQNVAGTTLTTWDFGSAAAEVGDLTDALGNTSTRYPLFDLAVPHYGAYGNLNGISIWSPKLSDIQIANQQILDETGAFPLRLELRSKDTPTASPTVQNTLMGAREMDFVIKSGAKSKGGVRLNLEESFVRTYNEMNPVVAGTPPTYGPFDKLHVYTDNIDKIRKDIYKAEIALEQISDLSGLTLADVDKEYFRVNFVGGHHIDGTPYQTVRQADLGTVGTLFDSSVVHWATGGVDGILSDAEFAAEVEALMAEFGDPNGKYSDDVTFNDSVFYDTGYPISTKLTIPRYMSTRKDRYVVMTTHVAGEAKQTAAEENARLAMIVGAVRLYPDSTYWNTANFRAVAVKGSMKLIESYAMYDHRVPVSFELMMMDARWRGGMNGKQLPVYDLTEGENNYLSYGTDYSNPWTPYRVRNAAWSSGGMWAEKDERGRYYFPAIRTIFGDDTSTLLNFRVMVAHVELNKIGAEMRRRFTGKDWSEARFKDEIENWFYTQIGDNKFGGKLKVEGECIFTAIDTEKGFAWHFVARVYGDNIKTVQTFYSENYRMADLPDDSNARTA